MTPTPASLTQSLLDLGGGFRETVVPPNVLLGDYITRQAKRIMDRVPADDPRLASFAGQANQSGYVWFGLHTFDFFEQAARESWSFERWFTTLADRVAELEPLSAEYLAKLTAAGEHIEAMARQGFTCTTGREGGLLFNKQTS